MPSIKSYLMKHPISSFFILTFLLSWFMFFVALNLIPENELYRAPFITIGAFSPALISILLSRDSEIGKMKNNKKRIIVFILVWSIAFVNIILFSVIIRDFTPEPILILIGIILALLPAFVLSEVFSKNYGIRNHLKTLIIPKGQPIYYVFALISIPLILQASAMITRSMNGSLLDPPYSVHGIGLVTVLLMILLTFVSHFLNSGGVAEEPGWRGFAVKHIQTKYNPLIAGLVVGFFWALWHIPVMMSQLEAQGPVIVILQILILGITFTWLFNRTCQSILSVAILHASWNTGMGFIPRTQIFYLIMTVLIVIMVVSDKMWKKASSIS